MHAPASADSSAGCGECAAPRGPYLSYATPCKSATITEQRQRWQWQRNFPPDGARSALAFLCFPRCPLAPVPTVIKGQQPLFTRCAGHYRTRRHFTPLEDEKTAFHPSRRALSQQRLHRPPDSAPADYSGGLKKRVIVGVHYTRAPPLGSVAAAGETRPAPARGQKIKK